MIYLTGDTHGDFRRFGNRLMKRKGMNFSEKDYMIICGDFGLCWEEDGAFTYGCEFFAGKPYTTLWVQGNHENYDMIKSFPVEEWHGGKVRHIVRDKVILLERGQIYEIEGKTFFTFGGASSHDIQGGVLERNDPDFKHKVRLAKDNHLPYRILHESWWQEELPSQEEMQEGLRNLEKVNNSVDYIITHCCTTEIHKAFGMRCGEEYTPDCLTDYLQDIEEKVTYKHWYFGHYHEDENVDDKHSLLYRGIIKLDDKETDFSKLPVPGRPRYMRMDDVIFHVGDCRKTGVIYIVDAYGTFEQNEEPSYDIYVAEENCIYKHIEESAIIETAF